MVVSPHFDDAALGAAHLLTAHPGSTVITVLGGRPAAYPDEVTDWDAAGGFGPATTWWRSGRRRTGPPWPSMQATPVWLDFPDHQYLAPDERPHPADVAPALAAGHRGGAGRPRCSCPWGWPIPTTS